MMSIDYIQRLSRERGSAASRQDLRPYVFFNGTDVEKNFSRIPNMGKYRASKHGWKLADYKTTDSSGFGQPGEPALTVDELQAWMKQYVDQPGTGWAIIEQGQFQVVIGRFHNSRIAVQAKANSVEAVA